MSGRATSVAIMAALAACSAGSPPVASTVNVPADADAAATEVTVAEPAATATAAVAAPPRASGQRSQLIDWLKAGLPEGGQVIEEPSGEVAVVHTVRAGDSYASVADAYVGLTEIYLARDLASAMQKQAPGGEGPQPGARIVIPSLVKSAPKPIEEERLGWPEDQALRGIYVRGTTAATPLFTAVLERMVDRGMNLIVLDTKDYDGFVSYATKAPIAVETGSAKKPPIRDLPRTIRFAHARGIRVAMRISSFEDEFVAKAKPSLCPIAKWGRPYNIGWLDPANPEAQQYVLDLTKEAIAAGADEVQLDYIRYPVLGIKGADFEATNKGKKKTEVIRDFVRRVHELTEPAHVMLSLDIFGIVAEGDRRDIDALGQDPALLGKEVEALNPMVYPSHYRPGYGGFEVPGNHPEIVGMGTRKVIAMMGKSPRAVVRPWLQAMDYKSPEYGPPYIAAEVRAAEHAGSKGWMMWNPGQTYTVTWAAIPPDAKRRAAAAAAAAAEPSAASEAPHGDLDAGAGGKRL